MNTHTITIESLYREFQPILTGYVAGCFPAFSFQDSEDVVQNLFVNIQKRGTRILGDCSLASLKRHASRQGIALVRERRAAKRHCEGMCSLDEAMELFGFEGSAVSDSYQGYFQELEMIDRVMDCLPHLSEREQILLKHIRKWLPLDLNPTELAKELKPLEHLRFIPLKISGSQEQMDALVVRQISRSKASLQQKLRKALHSLQDTNETLSIHVLGGGVVDVASP